LDPLALLYKLLVSHNCSILLLVPISQFEVGRYRIKTTAQPAANVPSAYSKRCAVAQSDKDPHSSVYNPSFLQFSISYEFHKCGQV
jgi:hypothetical protein